MIAELKPYPSYRDSKLQWLGSIPADWSTRRAKHLFHEMDERSSTGREELLSVSHLTGVTPRSQKTVTMFLARSNVGHKICRPGDVVINTMWAWMGALGVSRYTGLVSPSYGIYRPFRACGVLPEYADKILRTPLYVAEYHRRSTGVNSSRLRLYPEQFLDMPVLVPSAVEQKAIIRFLEWANSRLDHAIRSKRKIIALLNEQKQAIVQEVVTQGVGCYPRLKPSDLPTFSKIPQHWEVRRLKSLSRFVTSGSRGWARYYADAGSIFLRIGNISTTSVDLKLNRITYVDPPRGTEGERTQAIPGDILLSITAQIGAVGVVPAELGMAYVNQHTALVRLRPNAAAPRWVAYALLSRFGKDQCKIATNGGTKVGLTLDDVKCLLVPLPPIYEQEALVRNIDQKTHGINVRIAALQHEIDLLREYRTRLISDVVTGKLDVREAAAHLPDEAPPEPTEPDIDFTEEAEAEEAVA